MLTPQQAASVTAKERTQLATMEKAIDAKLRNYAGARTDVSEELKKASGRTVTELLRRYEQAGWTVERKQLKDQRGEPDGTAFYLTPQKPVVVPSDSYDAPAPQRAALFNRPGPAHDPRNLPPS